MICVRCETSSKMSSIAARRLLSPLTSGSSRSTGNGSPFAKRSANANRTRAPSWSAAPVESSRNFTGALAKGSLTLSISLLLPSSKPTSAVFVTRSNHGTTRLSMELARPARRSPRAFCNFCESRSIASSSTHASVSADSTAVS